MRTQAYPFAYLDEFRQAERRAREKASGGDRSLSSAGPRRSLDQALVTTILVVMPRHRGRRRHQTKPSREEGTGTRRTRPNEEIQEQSQTPAKPARKSVNGNPAERTGRVTEHTACSVTGGAFRGPAARRRLTPGFAPVGRIAQRWTGGRPRGGQSSPRRCPPGCPRSDGPRHRASPPH
jgi:hypothetical protein